MSQDNPYFKFFLIALGLHISIAVLLLFEPESRHPVLVKETQNTPGQLQPIAVRPEQQAIKAVSVDSQALKQAVDHLKMEKEKARKAEIEHQHLLNRQAEAAKQSRLREQQELVKLKKEAQQLALSHKKQLEEEKRRLEALAQQKVQETKRLVQLKKAQEQEARKLEDLKKQHEKKALAEKAKAEAKMQEAKRQADLAAANNNALEQARIAGEVDKYKALILNAISQKWILPDNANHNLSSQFRIRLAPDGAVMEVSLIRSSGDPILDRSAQSAIYKASPLPVPVDPATFNLFRDIRLTVRPEQIRG